MTTTDLTKSELGQRVIRAAMRASKPVPGDTNNEQTINVAEVAQLAGCTYEEADAVLRDVFDDAIDVEPT